MALARGGVAVDDPKAWWDSLSDDVAEFWRAYWRVEPWGCDWERHAETMSMLDLLYAVTINQHLKREDMHKPSPPDKFMPVDFYREPRPTFVLPPKDDIIKQLDMLRGRISK